VLARAEYREAQAPLVSPPELAADPPLAALL